MILLGPRVSSITERLRALTPPVSSPYALIAISNVNRGACYQQAVADVFEFVTVVVRDGDEATAEIGRQGPPRLLIVDLSLPRVDGFAVVRKVRRQATEIDTRIIVVAAHETLRAAARDLAGPLDIAAVLPLDVDKAELQQVLIAESRAMQRTSKASRQFVATKPPGSDVDDILDRAAVDARRRFQLAASVGY